MMPGTESFAGFMNYRFFLTDPAFFQAIGNTLMLVGGVLFATVVGGIALALLLDQPIFSQGIVRILVIAPFFVMGGINPQRIQVFLSHELVPFGAAPRPIDGRLEFP